MEDTEIMKGDLEVMKKLFRKVYIQNVWEPKSTVEREVISFF
jgi:hypothetical protein